MIGDRPKRNYTRSVLCVVCLIASNATASPDDGDWTQFRGPGGSGASNEKGLPAKWSSTENIVWKTKLPGPGTSSPIVLGDKIYLTCYSGYGLVADEGDMNKLRRHVLCMDRKSGKLLWGRPFTPVLGESKYGRGNNSRHGYASSTPTTDGEQLYVFFGKSGVYCLDLEGKEIWKTSVGTGTHGWGSSNSPILYKDLVIVNASVESRMLVALNKGSGKEIWRAQNIRSSWNTPVLVNVADGKTELVLCESKNVFGFDPATGKELWRVTGLGRYACPSVVAHEGIVYVVHLTSPPLAIRAGGRGDVTETHILWRGKGKSVVPSPVYYDGHLFWVPPRGTAYCLNAADGKTVYQERLSGKPGIIYASVLVADGKLYCATQTQGVYVLAAGPKFEQLAHNVFEDDNSRTNASPIASDGQLLMRTDRYLYCIGK